MPAKIIDGKAMAKKVKEAAARQSEKLKATGIHPHLIVFLVGDDPASAIYVRGKQNDCAECGIKSTLVQLPASTTQEELLQKINAANKDAGVHGILVQLPLPKQIEENKIVEAISPEKDVDGFTPVSLGRLLIGEKGFIPCTPAGCIYMLEESDIDLTGKDVVIVGRSRIVGKPLAVLFTAKNATVTLCHTKTKDLAAKCAAADILVAAAGRAGLITKSMIKPGAVVIDVGINRDENGKLHGDVDFEMASQVAEAITPVPGGVGPMTRAMLMQNTIRAAENFEDR